MNIFCYTEYELDGVDVIFMLDHSKSIKKAAWPSIINFTASVAMSLNIGLNESLVGVILFGRDASILFNVRQYPDKASLVNAIYSIQYNVSRGTNTWLALDLLRKSCLPNGTMMLREGVPHISILITDGRSQNKTATSIAAEELHNSGTFEQVYSVGIGSKRIDKNELKDIASDPSLAYTLTDSLESLFNELQHDLNQKILHICKLTASVYAMLIMNN